MLQQVITECGPGFDAITKRQKHSGLESTDQMNAGEEVAADLGFRHKSVVGMGEHAWAQWSPCLLPLLVPPLSHPAPHLASQPRQRQDAGMPSAPSSTYQRLPAPTALHRPAHAHEPCVSAADAHGAAGPRRCQATASPAPAEDVARRILGEDVTQIDYYTVRVKRMVGRVLTGNGITHYEKGVYSLVDGDELSDSERDELLQLCRQRLDAFREQRGDDVFAHRSRHRTPISGSVKYRVLTRAKGRCECCGARLLLSNARTSELWRWTTLCPKTRGDRTISATCRPSASAAMPASGTPIPATSAECRPATPSASRAVCRANQHRRD